MQPYYNQTRQNMEDDLNIFENRRRPNFFLKKEDDLNSFFFTGKQPHKQ
jgi:hypothetical protein